MTMSTGHPPPGDVRRFYDRYVSYQSTGGVNGRHHAILGSLRRFGLRRDHRVLEIGCGIGTLTQLLARVLRGRGSLVGVDISPDSIEAAKERLSSSGNVHLSAGDVLELELDGPFDVIVLPDVIEHMPLESHGELFERVVSWLAPGGFVLLNYPNPHYLAWCHEHTPELLQIIDQPVHADGLLAALSPHGLYLHHLDTYSIWKHEGDFVVAVLRRRADATTFTQVPPPSLVTRVRGRLRRLVT